MTKEAYLELCKAQNVEPTLSLIPLGLDDLDEVSQVAVAIFNSLNDTFIPSEVPMYNGKDVSGLPIMFELFRIEDTDDKVEMLQLIHILDGEARAASLAALKSKPKGPRLPNMDNNRR